MRSVFLGLVILSLYFIDSFAQQKIDDGNGITVIVPSKEKPKTTYFTFAGGYQIPSLVNVPMVPENSPNLVKESDMEVIIPGWFAQLGIHKKTRSNFEIGILGGYYSNSVHVALEGQRSTSDWVFEKSGDRFTEVYEEDVLRTSSTLVIRGAIKYKYDIQNINLWLGIAGGSFSSVIDYSYSNGGGEDKTDRKSTLGLSYLFGMDIIKKDEKNKDVFGVSLFADIAGPMINEFYISLFNPGWKYDNPTGNHSINPFRVGLSLNFY